MLKSERQPAIIMGKNDFIDPLNIGEAYIKGYVLYLHLYTGRVRIVNLSDPRFPAIAEEVQSVMGRKFVFEQEQEGVSNA